jgi:putative peptidoglycan lipid II flippase
LILLGRPLLELLYQRGAFDAAATGAVFVALRFYALGLVGHACLELAARAFFAQQDTVTPLFVAVGFAALNVVLGVLLIGPMGHAGLALANSLAVSAEVLVLLFILQKRWGGIEAGKMLSSLSRVVLATLLMGFAVTRTLASSQRASMGLFLTVALSGATGVLVYVAAGWLLRVQALRWPLDALLDR